MTPQSPCNSQKSTITVTVRRKFLGLAGILTGVLLLNPAAQSQTPVNSASDSLFGTDPNTFWLTLVRSRPPAVTAEFKGYVIHTLPEKGEVKKLKESQRRKLESVKEMLRLHERESVYEIKVIGTPHAFVGLHARCVLLITEAALNLFSTEELQASVAHEIGHEYVWPEYESARQRKDYPRLQQLEMFCDAVSIATLHRAGVNPSGVVSAFTKLLRLEHGRFGPGIHESYYPPPDDRKKFDEAVMKWVASLKPEGAPQ